MLGLAGRSGNQISPQAADHFGSGIEALDDEAGADQRFHHIAEDIVAVLPAIVAGLFAQANVRPKIDRPRHHKVLSQFTLFYFLTL